MKSNKIKTSLILCLLILSNTISFGQTPAKGETKHKKIKLEYSASIGTSLINNISRGQDLDQFFDNKLLDSKIAPDQGHRRFQYLNLKIGKDMGNGGFGLSASISPGASDAIYGNKVNVNSVDTNWAIFKIQNFDSRLGAYIGAFNKSGKVRIYGEIGAIYSSMKGNLNWLGCPVSTGYDITGRRIGLYTEAGFYRQLYKKLFFDMSVGSRNIKMLEKHKNINTGATETFTVEYQNSTNPLKVNWSGTYMKIGLTLMLRKRNS